MKYFKKLVGNKIYLSPVNTEDAEQFVCWLNDFNVTDYIGRSGKIVTIQDEKEYLTNPKNLDCHFFIVNLENDKLLGSISLHDIDLMNRKAVLGIFIGDNEDRNNGYGTEAIKLLLDYGFNYMNLNNIELSLMEFNERALACYKKCGFKEYGRRRKCNFINGKYYDSIKMDILAEEFNEDAIQNKNIK